MPQYNYLSCVTAFLYIKISFYGFELLIYLRASQILCPIYKYSLHACLEGLSHQYYVLHIMLECLNYCIQNTVVERICSLQQIRFTLNIYLKLCTIALFQIQFRYKVWCKFELKLGQKREISETVTSDQKLKSALVAQQSYSNVGKDDISKHTYLYSYL